MRQLLNERKCTVIAANIRYPLARAAQKFGSYLIVQEDIRSYVRHV